MCKLFGALLESMEVFAPCLILISFLVVFSVSLEFERIRMKKNKAFKIFVSLLFVTVTSRLSTYATR